MHLILSSNFSFYPQRSQSVLDKTNQHGSKVGFFGCFSYYSWGLRDLSPAPSWVLASTWAPLIVSQSVLKCLFFSPGLLPFWDFKSLALLTQWNGCLFWMLIHQESYLPLYYSASFCCHTNINSAYTVLVTWVGKDLSVCESLADKLLQYFYLPDLLPFHALCRTTGQLSLQGTSYF